MEKSDKAEKLDKKDYRYLKVILFNLFSFRNLDILTRFRHNFKGIYSGMSIPFDRIISILEEFQIKYERFPEAEGMFGILNSKGFPESTAYLAGILENDSLDSFKSDTQFYEFMERAKADCMGDKADSTMEKIKSKYTKLARTEKAISDYVSETLHDIINLQDHISPDSKAIDFDLSGEDAVEAFRKHYKELEDAKNRGEQTYFNVPFECFNSVSIKPGDLLITGGFTSHGKSVFLRHLSYHYIINHARNVAFYTLETSAEVVRSQFYILHANNKLRFPNSVRIEYAKYKKGELNEEEKEFLNNVVIPDFCTSTDYGELTIHKPNKTKFNLDDLRIDLREKQSRAPLDIVAVDYLSLMYPLKKDSKGTPGTEDYNQMIKEFKQLMLTNLNNKGEKYPLIGLTAAQVSRQGYEQCLKLNKTYNTAAFSSYTELERSADVLMTILRDPELAREKKVKLQVLKNRDGEIPYEGKEFVCDLAFGAQILDAKENQQLDLSAVLRELEV